MPDLDLKPGEYRRKGLRRLRWWEQKPNFMERYDTLFRWWAWLGAAWMVVSPFLLEWTGLVLHPAIILGFVFGPLVAMWIVVLIND